MVALTIQSLRVALSLMILVVGTMLAMSGASRSLVAQTGEPCEFDDGTDDWACAEMPHMWEGQCEGFDCYTTMEFCCIMIE